MNLSLMYGVRKLHVHKLVYLDLAHFQSLGIVSVAQFEILDGEFFPALM